MILNPPLSRMLQAESVMVHDGTHAFRVRNFYIKPEVDWRTLENLGFTEITAYRLTDGQPFPSKGTLTKAEDPWVYFTAQKPTV